MKYKITSIKKRQEHHELAFALIPLSLAIYEVGHCTFIIESTMSNENIYDAIGVGFGLVITPME